MGLITSIAHINLTVPRGTLHLAEEFYGTTLGLTSVPVPVLQKGTLAWFDIVPGGQQIHIGFEAGSENLVSHGENGATGSDTKENRAIEKRNSSRHPCFKLGSAADLEELKTRIWTHFEKGGESRPLEADRPGKEGSGAKGVEYPTRFFARDFAGNRLEFSL